MSVDLMGAAWAVRGLSHTGKIVLLALADNANDAGVCWPSIPNIAARCSLEERSVYRTIALLEGGGHVTTQARPGKSTVYRVHPKTPDSKSVPPLTGSHPDRKSGTPDSLSPLPPSPPSQTLPSYPPSGNPQEPSRGRRASARARSRTVPEDFSITEAMREWAKAKCPNVDVDAETEKFRDHEYREPHSNWPAAWRQWMRRAPEFAPSARPVGNGLPTLSPTRTWRPPPDEETQNAER